jgi:FkbM family methyltransferase
MPTLRQRLVASITRRYPFYSGCGKVANHPLLLKAAGTSDEVAWGRVHGGLKVAAPLDDHVGRAIFYVGELDRKITWVSTHIVRSGDTVLDVGANLGLVTFALASMVGPAGRVISFEPNPLMVKHLEEGIRRNSVRNVEVHPVALGAVDAELPLTIPPVNAGSASFLRERDTAGSTEVTVPVRRLSDVLTSEHVGHIRLVKIDVEGYEPQVLAGATDFFRESPPDAVLFELNEQTDDDIHPTIATLRDLGYGFFSLPRKLVRMHAYTVNPEQATLHGNDFVAARLGRTYNEIAILLRATPPPAKEHSNG